MIRSISSPDDIMTAAAANSTSSFGTGPIPRTSSTRPTTKIRPPAMKNGRIVGQIDGSTGARPTAETKQQGEARGEDHGQAAQARDGMHMNLPAAWGVYQSKPRRTPSNHGSQQQGQDGTTQSEQQVHSQCEPPLS